MAQSEEAKAKAKAKSKERKRELNELDYEKKEQLATMDSAYIADYIAKLVAKSDPELSDLELQDRVVPQSQIIETSQFKEPRELNNYASFFEEFQLSEKSGKRGDLVLVLCISAIRVCEIVRQLRTKEIGGALKLIKQNKFDYDKRCLRSPCHVAVSTAGRIIKLQELKIFDPKRVSRIVIDSSMIDVKQRTVWDIDGTLELVTKLGKTAKIFLF